MRKETDSLGNVLVPKDAYFGSATQRSLHYFPSKDRMPYEVVLALVLIKRMAAKTLLELGFLNQKQAQVITQACLEIEAGKFHDQFPLSVWQTGSGTGTNMNVNEVIANRANELLGSPKGEKHPIHPNDHVNYGQSSNDCFPTAMHIATIQSIHKNLLPFLNKLEKALENKVEAFKDTQKVGRTHLQDAVTLTLGQEFSGYLAQIKAHTRRLEHSLPDLYALAQGATAVGTGLNCPKGFVERFMAHIVGETGYPFTSNPNKFEALACHDALVHFSGVLNGIAVSLMKIANDIRLMGSGPRCGLGELLLPQNEPGSSIMPGKVNPTQIEALTMVCCQVMGYHMSISIAGSQGHFELNVFKPLIIYNVLHSMTLLSQVGQSFITYCLNGLRINQKTLQKHQEENLMCVTSLVPTLGYDKAAQVSLFALKHDLSLEEAMERMDLEV